MPSFEPMSGRISVSGFDLDPVPTRHPGSAICSPERPPVRPDRHTRSVSTPGHEAVCAQSLDRGRGRGVGLGIARSEVDDLDARGFSLEPMTDRSLRHASG